MAVGIILSILFLTIYFLSDIRDDKNQTNLEKIPTAMKEHIFALQQQSDNIFIGIIEDNRRPPDQRI